MSKELKIEQLIKLYIMLKVKIEKEPEKEAQIKSLKSENDVWYFDSDEEFENFAIVSKRDSEEYTSGYEFAVRTGKVYGQYKIIDQI